MRRNRGGCHRKICVESCIQAQPYGICALRRTGQKRTLHKKQQHQIPNAKHQHGAIAGGTWQRGAVQRQPSRTQCRRTQPHPKRQRQGKSAVQRGQKTQSQQFQNQQIGGGFPRGMRRSLCAGQQHPVKEHQPRVGVGGLAAGQFAQTFCGSLRQVQHRRLCCLLCQNGSDGVGAVGCPQRLAHGQLAHAGGQFPVDLLQGISHAVGAQIVHTVSHIVTGSGLCFCFVLRVAARAAVLALGGRQHTQHLALGRHGAGRGKQTQRVAHGSLLHAEPPQTALGGTQGHAQIGVLMRGQHRTARQLYDRAALGVRSLQNHPQLRHRAPPGVMQLHQHGKFLAGLHGAGGQLQRHRHIAAQRADIPRQKSHQQHHKCQQKHRKRRTADRSHSKQHRQQQPAADLTCHGGGSPGGGAARCAEPRQG